MQKKINIQNKRARFEYDFLDQFTAGIVLTGTEIKSIRNSQASITESFCEFNEHNELFIVNMYIEEYGFASHFNHRPRGSRKLLLNKRELIKLHKEVKNSGLTIVPLKLFLNENSFAKIRIALVKGKKYMTNEKPLKTETIKESWIVLRLSLIHI